MNPTPANRRNRLSEELDVSYDALQEFDVWMTRQLNCLAGRWIRFATPNQSARGRRAAGSNSNRVNTIFTEE